MARHNGSQLWEPRHRSVDRNLADDTPYQHRLHPDKPHPTAFRNATSVTTTEFPRLENFVQLTDGGSRDSRIYRYLASDNASVVMDGRTYPIPKRSIVLIECLGDGAYRTSIPTANTETENSTNESEDNTNE
jgi:hypothetical protein